MTIVFKIVSFGEGCILRKHSWRLNIVRGKRGIEKYKTLILQYPLKSMGFLERYITVPQEF